MLGKYEDPAVAATKIPAPQPAPMQRDKRDASPNTLDLVRRDVVFFMAQLNDNMMSDVGLGADISNTELRDLKAIILPQITKSIDDLRKVLKIYTSYHNYDHGLAREAQDKCEYSSLWASDVMSRYHQQKLHLHSRGSGARGRGLRGRGGGHTGGDSNRGWKRGGGGSWRSHHRNAGGRRGRWSGPY